MSPLVVLFSLVAGGPVIHAEAGGCPDAAAVSQRLAGLLTIQNRDLGAAVVERVAVDWPSVSTLPDKGQPNGLRKRRGRLRAASLLIDGPRLALLAQATS